MADNDRSFPKIADSNWWQLRNLFRQKVPAEVTRTYLASALSMTESSARANIITPFKKLGFLDEQGKPTDIAYDWRDDSKYPTVCQTLLEKIYPQEVRDLFPSIDRIDADPETLVSWFMNYCRCGEPAARMYARFYRLLLKADPSLTTEPATQKEKLTVSAKRQKLTAPRKKAASMIPKETDPTEGQTLLTPKKQQQPHGSLPQLHINIQLHISPETTAEQIDKIFESMARHLKDFKL